MAARQSVVVGLKVLGKRQFWSFKVVHALLGGLLTLAGAAGGVFVGDSLTKRIRGLDEQIASLDSRIETISSILAQFRVVQSNGILLGALSTSDGITLLCGRLAPATDSDWKFIVWPLGAPVL